MNGRYIFLYKVEGGRRQKYRYTLDAQMTIIAEEPCHENGVPHAVTDGLKAKNRQTEAALAASPQLQRLRERGFEFHLEGGQIHLDKIPEIEKQIALFFIPDAECPFPGCEALRQKYLEDLERLKGEDGVCSDCDKGALQEKYRKVVKKNVEAQAVNDSVSQVSARNP